MRVPRPLPAASGEPLLELTDLHAYYGSAQALEGVSFSMTKDPVAIVGRNGMGKTTLCNAIMGISPPRASGSIKFAGDELVGVPPHKIARRGLGYVPQGRRLFPSLTVDQHLRIAARGSSANGGGEWTRERVYELFPRLAERKRNGGAQLSGGEQQMLAIGRALMTNPRMLVMDEPSEGLAPAVIESLIEAFKLLEEQGHGDPADRAEPRHGHGARGTPADHDRRADRRRDDRRASSPATRICNAGTSASSRSRTSLSGRVQNARALVDRRCRRRRGVWPPGAAATTRRDPISPSSARGTATTPCSR